jgi:hypothetical protein
MCEYHSQLKRCVLLNYSARNEGIRQASFFFHVPFILESSKVLLAMPYLTVQKLDWFHSTRRILSALTLCTLRLVGCPQSVLRKCF